MNSPTSTPSKKNRKSSLLVECNTILLEQNHKRVLVNLFVETMPNLIEHLKRKDQ